MKISLLRSLCELLRTKCEGAGRSEGWKSLLGVTTCTLRGNRGHRSSLRTWVEYGDPGWYGRCLLFDLSPDALTSQLSSIGLGFPLWKHELAALWIFCLRRLFCFYKWECSITASVFVSTCSLRWPLSLKIKVSLANLISAFSYQWHHSLLTVYVWEHGLGFFPPFACVFHQQILRVLPQIQFPTGLLCPGLFGFFLSVICLSEPLPFFPLDLFFFFFKLVPTCSYFNFSELFLSLYPKFIFSLFL